MKIWMVKIGECPDWMVPKGADVPMREAVAKAYESLIGVAPDFIFSGWAGELSEPERAVVENRLPQESAASPETKVTPSVLEVELPLLNVTEEDMESSKALWIDPSLQPDNLTDIAAWWIKIIHWMGGARVCRERQLLAALKRIADLERSSHE